MPLARSIVGLPLAQGIDTKTDPRALPAGKLTTLQNGRLTKPGRIVKRAGYEPVAATLPGGATLTAGRAVATYKGDLFVADGAKGYSLSAAGATSKGSLIPLQVSTTSVVRNTSAQTSPDACVHPLGITVVAWEDSRGGVRYSVLDTASGQPVVADVQATASGNRPRCVLLGGGVLILYADTTSGTALKAIMLSAAAPSSPPAPITVTSALAAAVAYDAVSANGRVYVAFVNNAGANQISLLYITAALSFSAIANPTGAIGTAYGIAVAPDSGGNIWTFWTATGGLTEMKWDRNLLTSLVSPTVVDPAGTNGNVTAIASGTGMAVLEEIQAVDAYDGTTTLYFISSAGAATGNYLPQVGIRVASRLFAYGGDLLCLLAFSSTLQPTYFLYDFTAGAVIGKVAPGTGGGFVAHNILPSVSSIVSGVYWVPYLEAYRSSAASGSVLFQLGVQIGKFDFTAPLTALELSDDLHLAGGILWSFDGSSIAEHGFHWYPEIVSGSLASGGSLSAGSYQWVVVWEWTDAQGLVHRSAPSIPVTLTALAGQSGQIVVRGLTLTSKPTSPLAVLYRTQANQSVFYRVTPVGGALATYTNGLSAFTITDGAPDASIAGNEQLYTTGGEVSNIAAPAPAILANFKGRQILVPSEDRNQFWYSKPALEGVPVEFSDTLVNEVDRRLGGITAAGQLDATLVLFGASSMAYVVGDGLAADGSGTDFAPAQMLPFDVGCSNPRSVVTTPAGMFFQSAKGLFLLDRGLGVSYVGAPVEGLLAGQTVVRALVAPASTEVRFYLAGGGVLVYDYFVGQWSSDPSLALVDAAAWNGAVAGVEANGLILQETPGAFDDNGRAISVLAQTGWISFAGLQGFQRVRRVLFAGEYKSPHILTISIAYDYEPAPTQVVNINTATLIAQTTEGSTYYGGDPVYGGAFPLYQFMVHVARQKCEAIQITIQDAPAPLGEGFSLSSIAFEVGLKQGSMKLPVARTVG